MPTEKRIHRRYSLKLPLELKALAEGAKSVSFRLTVGSPERTLSSEEIGGIRTRIIERMRELGYEFRE